MAMSTLSVGCIPVTSSKLASSDSTASGPKVALIPRRIILPSLIALVPVLPLVGVGAASAKDIPLFGIRRRDVEKVEREVVEEVKEIVREGEELVSRGEKAVEEAADGNVAPTPLLQAGTLVGAEIVATLVASSLVNGLLGES